MNTNSRPVELKSFHSYKQGGKTKWRAFVHGELVPDGERYNVVNPEGNLLLQGATSGMLDALSERGYLTYL